MSMKIGLVLSIATFLGLAAGCAPAANLAMSSHATFAGSQEYSTLALPGTARLKGDPQTQSARVDEAGRPSSATIVVARKDSLRAHVL